MCSCLLSHMSDCCMKTFTYMGDLCMKQVVFVIWVLELKWLENSKAAP